jgi:hypothetical protein
MAGPDRPSAVGPSFWAIFAGLAVVMAGPDRPSSVKPSFWAVFDGLAVNFFRQAIILGRF